MTILNKQVLIIGIILLLMIIFIPLRKKLNKNQSKLVANTRFIMNTRLYKHLNRKFRILTIIFIISFSITFIFGILLSSRLVETKEETIEKSSRDIFIVLDVSPSVYDIDYDITKAFINLINNLDGDRVGLSIFDSSTYISFPLTDDYEFALNILSKYRDSFEKYLSGDRKALNDIVSLAQRGGGSSLVGDGLMTTLLAMTREFDSDINRTRITILSTDNAAGRGVVTLDEAIDFARLAGIKTYGITHEKYKDAQVSINFIKSIQKNNGKVFFGYGAQQIQNIINEINTTNKTIIQSESNAYQVDIPIYFFIALLISFLFYQIILTRKIIN